MTTIDNVIAAKRNKKDEFYTTYKDIKKEIDIYFNYNVNLFKNKTILLPCDDYEKSNFTKYFIDNFDKFKLKRIISTCYNYNNKGKILIYEKNKIKNGNLKTNGDFRNDDITELRNKSDIIITNPPFSLFREFFDWLINSNKLFLTVTNLLSLSYNDIFPYIQNNKVWLGNNKGNFSGFIIPEYYNKKNNIFKINNTLWITNIDYGKERFDNFIELKTINYHIQNSKHKEIKNIGFLKYDNLDAINIPFVDSIPSDYEGIMGVPITFLNKYNPKQFKIIGLRKNLKINNKNLYDRVLIKKL